MDIDIIRDEFVHMLYGNQFVTDKSGVRTLELIGTSFVASKDTIFGEVNDDYVERELSWYQSMSLAVEDIPGGAPAIWKQVADTEGYINSNYGWLIWSETNGQQYLNTMRTLKKDPNSRRAIMIYTRPTMHVDYNKKGMSDFICTNTVQYFVRNDTVHAVVNMRSNDVVFGYRNDRAWQEYVLKQLASDLGLDAGTISWQTGSLHIYERHFYLVDHFARTGDTSITKAKYQELYPDSKWGKV